MDYEKAYKAVLKTATQWIKDGCTDKEKICLECVIPELRESEEEQSRKKIEQLIRLNTSGAEKTQLLAYLEKQKEQKPAEWSDEDEKDVAHIIRILDDCYAYGRHDLSKTDHENLVGTLKSLRPSWKPSEEQMKVLLNAEGLVRANNYNENAKILASLYEQLKKL